MWFGWKRGWCIEFPKGQREPCALDSGVPVHTVPPGVLALPCHGVNTAMVERDPVLNWWSDSIGYPQHTRGPERHTIDRAVWYNSTFVVRMERDTCGSIRIQRAETRVLSPCDLLVNGL